VAEPANIFQVASSAFDLVMSQVMQVTVFFPSFLSLVKGQDLFLRPLVMSKEDESGPYTYANKWILIELSTNQFA
jgi:hypothetical protein